MFKTKKKVNGVYALQPEKYFLPVEAEISIQKTDRSWWAHPVFIVFLTIAMSAMDALILYSIMDIALTQSEWMGKLTAFGIALVLNIIPLMVAKFIHQAIYHLKKYAMVWAIVAVMAFTLLFGATVYLRFAYQDAFENTSSMRLVNTLEMEDTVEEDNTDSENKAMAVVLLLSVEPLCTSLASFVLAYLSDDELRDRINRLRLRRIELVESRSDILAAIACMDGERQELVDQDNERYLASQHAVHARCELLKARARNYLAEYLADPTAISKLSEEALYTDGKYKEDAVSAQYNFKESA